MEEKNDKAARAFALPEDVKESRLRKVRAKLNQAHPMPEYSESNSALAIGKLLALLLLVAVVADMLMR